MDVYLLGEGCGVHDLTRVCLDRGVTILGFVDPVRRLTLHAKAPTLTLEEVALRPFDLIVVANPTFANSRTRLLELGVDASRILVFYEDVPGALDRLGPVVAFTTRRRGLAGEYRVHARGQVHA